MKQEDVIIKIEHLGKSFGDVKAVKDLSFQVRKGELFAFLGGGQHRVDRGERCR